MREVFAANAAGVRLKFGVRRVGFVDVQAQRLLLPKLLVTLCASEWSIFDGEVNDFVSFQHLSLRKSFRAPRDVALEWLVAGVNLKGL